LPLDRSSCATERVRDFDVVEAGCVEPEGALLTLGETADHT
jgi:hypothetical protein